jgi:hypothetical protein
LDTSEQNLRTLAPSDQTLGPLGNIRYIMPLCFFLRAVPPSCSLAPSQCKEPQQWNISNKQRKAQCSWRRAQTIPIQETQESDCLCWFQFVCACLRLSVPFLGCLYPVDHRQRWESASFTFVKEHQFKESAQCSPSHSSMFPQTLSFSQTLVFPQSLVIPQLQCSLKLHQ